MDLLTKDMESWICVLEFVPKHDLQYLLKLAVRLSGVGNALCYGLEADSKMGDTATGLTVLDVCDQLQDKYAYVTGGRSSRGRSIITFPDSSSENVQEITDVQYKKIVTYLTSIPSLQEAELGFCLIIDRRTAGWLAVKTMLARISDFFPGLVHEVFVIRPVGFFSRTYADVCYKLVKNDFKFQVVMCNSIKELHKHVPPDQLTPDLDGTLDFDHSEWIQHQASVEKFAANTSNIGRILNDLFERLKETEFPNTAISTELLIKDHRNEATRVENDLTSHVSHGEGLLEILQTEVCRREETGDEEGEVVKIPTYQLSPSRHQHVTTVQRLLSQLAETKTNFSEFWTKHETRLCQCLQLRKYEESFKAIQSQVEGNITMLNNMNPADNLDEVHSYLSTLEDIEEQATVAIDKAESLKQEGEDLIEEEHYAVDCIRPKCLELQRMCEQYRSLMRHKYGQLQQAKQLHTKIGQVKSWCEAGRSLLETHNEGSARSKTTDVCLNQLNVLLESTDRLQLNHTHLMYEDYQDVLTTALQKTISETREDMDDVYLRCQDRRTLLVDIITRDRTTCTQQTTCNNNSHNQHKAPTTRRTSQNIEKLDPQAVLGKATSTRPVPPNTHTATTLRVNVSLQDYNTLHAKRGHVMKELIHTERIYVSELRDILQGYYNEIDNPLMHDLIPVELIGQRDVLFGNLPDIYEFHEKIFLNDVENCQDTPALVGKCIVDRQEKFRMYSYYCQNKTKAEALRNTIGDDHPFFKECQRRLDHKLPIGAYLLKPVQRITKYQLLLKEMIRYTSDESPANSELKNALDTMLDVLKQVNDVMHQVGITGYHGNLSDLGRLLMQGSFSVWQENKKDIKIIDIRFKPKQRHLFLYESAIIFCKKVTKDDSKTDKDGAIYSYKYELSTKDIGLTETCKSDKRRFELSVWGRPEFYTIQAPNLTVKNEWMQAINKVLRSQFNQIKETVKREIHAMPLQSKDNTNRNLALMPRELQLTACTSPTPSHTITPTHTNHIHQQQTCSNTNNPSPTHTHMPTISPNKSHSDSTCSSLSSNKRDSLLFNSNASEDESWASCEIDDISMTSSSQAAVGVPTHEEYTVIADYHPQDLGELSLHEGDTVRRLKIGRDGWWYVRYLGGHVSSQTATHDTDSASVRSVEGWAPASYFDSNKRRSRSTISLSSSESFNGLSTVHPTMRHHAAANSKSHRLSMEVKSSQDNPDQLLDTQIPSNCADTVDATIKHSGATGGTGGHVAKPASPTRSVAAPSSQTVEFTADIKSETIV